MKLQYKPRTSRDLPWLNYSIFDAIWGFVAPLLAFFLREPASFSTGLIQITLLYATVACGFTVLAFMWFRLSNSVAQYFSTIDAMAIIKASIVAVLLTILACFFISRLETIPRSIPLLHLVLLVVGNAGGRILRRERMRRQRVSVHVRATENIVVVGANEMALLYIQMIEEFSVGTRQIVAFLDNRSTLKGRFVRGYPVAGRIQELEQVLNEYDLHGVKVHKLVLMFDIQEATASDRSVLEKIAAGGVLLEALPSTLGLASLSESPSDDIEIDKSATQRLNNQRFWISKRLFDFFLALAILIVALPMIVVVAALVFLNCGLPLLFWQVRLGRFGHRITVYKFRTLKAPYDEDGRPVPEDERLSSVGRFIRKIRVDELPQLFSVLTGEMSLIGPRPLLPVDLPSLIGLRLAVRPGLTGWAQVNGATLLTITEKDAMDEWYVRHASWALDFKIFLMTARVLINGGRRDEEAIRQALAEKEAVGAGT